MAAGSLLGGADTSALTNATEESRLRAADFYRHLALLQQQYQQQLAAQSALGRSLDKTIAGTAPSVAQTQLQQGLGQTRATLSAQAAGAGGNNAVLGNYGAIQALGAAQTKQQQDAALLRAQEIQAAQAAKANLLAQQQQATGVQSGQTTGAGTALTGIQTTGASNIAEQNRKELEAERALVSNVANSGTGLVSKSDETAKKDIQSIPSNEMDDFLKHISGFSFRFKGGGTGPGEGTGNRVGVMAQDVKAGGPVGRAVSDGKQLDMRNAIGALLAAVAHVNDKIEGKAA